MKSIFVPLAAAVIGALATLGAPLVPVIWSDFFMSKPSGFSRSIDGIWEGQGIQKDGFQSQTLASDIRLEISGSEDGFLVGDMQLKIQNPNGQEIVFDFRLTGDFIQHRFANLEYNTKAADVIRFGSYLLELSSDGKRLHGYAVGFSAAADKLTIATLELERSKLN